MGLDASHHTRIFLRGEENLFFLTSSFIGRVLTVYQQVALRVNG
jgi:hypothetical protein